jgi:hypothetical protein
MRALRVIVESSSGIGSISQALQPAFNTFAEEMAVAVPGSVDLSVLPPDLRSLPEHRNRHRRATSYRFPDNQIWEQASSRLRRSP